MSRREDESTAGSGTETGGAGEHDKSHSNIIPENIPSGGIGPDQKYLLPDIAAAIAFLDAFCGDGLRVLTSIPPDGGRTTTATFIPGQRDQMAAWIDERQGKQNIYFTVNELFGPVSSKPKKTDMVAALALHVDVDPRAGEDLNSERERVENVLRSYDPAPTVIIDSGGGFQGFWLFDAPIALSGEYADEARHLPVEDRNRKIETVLGGDNCHNIDRIMCLPGTINVPGEKKRKRGRTAALAKLVVADWSRRYKLEDFPSLAKPGASVPTAGPARRVSVAADVDVSALPVNAAVMALIVNSADPDAPGKWDDRSQLVFYILCEMIRADVPEDVMKAVILDPDLGISAHVREQKDADAYADRQIQRALAEQPRPGPVLSGGAMSWARELREARRPRLLHHNEEFLDWDGAAYVDLAEAWAFLETCRIRDKEELRPFIPNRGAVSATLDALRAVSHLARSREEPPRWLDGRSGPDPLELLPTRSGLLHLPTGELMPATPALFTRNALDFWHNPAAPTPERWLTFLKEVWPGEDGANWTCRGLMPLL